MLLVDGHGLPLAVDVDSASPAEVTLIEPLLEQAVTPYVPTRLIYDRAADSDALRKRLASRGIELICPHRKGRVRPATQDGRPLRRYRKRWIVERTISWLQAFRRIVTRYEFYAVLFHSFAKLACLMIVLRRF
jgi:transposase